MSDLDSLINNVKDKIGNLISKPKMSDKLLSKPPFRFLHDTISSVINATGFGEGLYEGAELDSAGITDKQAKINYLEKMFTLVGICTGGELDVRAAKVVAGLEPENTNSFLCLLSDCAQNDAIDNSEAVRRALAGEVPGSSNPPLKKAESKNAPEPSNNGSKNVQSPVQSEAKGGGSPVPSFDAKEFVEAPERGKSRGGTRGGKPKNSSDDVGLSGVSNVKLNPNLDTDIEKCDGSEATTQALLGELITKPKLSEKLLSKPPFRFLHDIIMEIIKTTGFGTGLYSGAETDSQSINSEKSAKIAFLDKIIQLVGLQLNTLVEARSVKIVAGLDAQNTNQFLQLLAVAAKNVPDSSVAVRNVLDKLNGVTSNGENAPPVAVVAPPKEKETAHRVTSSQSVQKQNDVQAEPKEENLNVVASSKGDERREIVVDEKSNEDEDGEQKRSGRPTTARRRPPKVKDGAKEVTGKEAAPVAKRTEGIMRDGDADDDDDIEDESGTRLADEVRADDKGTNANEAQSKLVKDILSRQAEQQAAQIIEPVAEEKAEEKLSGSGIRLGRRSKSVNDKKKGGLNDIDGKNASNVMGEGDIERLRAAIQVLTQHTGPLKACMEYIQEDVGMMTTELHKWEEDCRKSQVELEIETRKSRELLHSLQMQEADLDDQIAEQISRISSTKASIARNDDRISQMLKLIATS